MKKYDGYTGIVTKFGKQWRWVRQFRREVEIFRVEPYYEFDCQAPRWRPGEEGRLTTTVMVRGVEYTFAAKRVGCSSCDGGIRRKLGLRPHGGVCYCDGIDNTVIVFDHDRMTDEQKINAATYHLDQQMNSFW
jgi:hypothetical protein